MKLKEYKRLREILEAEAAKANAAAVKAQSELAALDLVWSAAQRIDGAEDEASSAGGAARASRSPFVEPVRKLIQALPESFTWLDVQRALQDAHRDHPDIDPSEFKRTTIVGILNRLVAEQLIEVAEPGAGRRAAKYRRRDTAA